MPLGQATGTIERPAVSGLLVTWWMNQNKTLKSLTTKNGYIPIQNHEIAGVPKFQTEIGCRLKPVQPSGLEHMTVQRLETLRNQNGTRKARPKTFWSLPL